MSYDRIDGMIWIIRIFEMDTMICAICHDQIDRYLHKNHCKCMISFHTKCIERWYDMIKCRKCPICRRLDSSPHHNKQTEYYTDFLSDRINEIFDPMIQWILDQSNHPVEIISLVYFIMYIVLSYVLTFFIVLPIAIFYFVESVIIRRLATYYYNRIDVVPYNHFVTTN